MTEHYVSRREMARILGVSPRQMDRYIRDGMPSETWGGRKRFFLPSATLDWAKKRRPAAGSSQ